jgi:hypothetical protein
MFILSPFLNIFYSVIDYIHKRHISLSLIQLADVEKTARQVKTLRLSENIGEKHSNGIEREKNTEPNPARADRGKKILCPVLSE